MECECLSQTTSTRSVVSAETTEASNPAFRFEDFQEVGLCKRRLWCCLGQATEKKFLKFQHTARCKIISIKCTNSVMFNDEWEMVAAVLEPEISISLYTSQSRRRVEFLLIEMRARMIRVRDQEIKSVCCIAFGVNLFSPFAFASILLEDCVP